IRKLYQYWFGNSLGLVQSLLAPRICKPRMTGRNETNNQLQEVIMNLRNLVALVFLLSMPGAWLYAQDRGIITGQVVDASGAAMPAPKAPLTTPPTGQIIITETKREGVYTFLSLTPGRYEVAAEKAGFHKARATDVLVQVSTATRLDIRLELGEVAETVQI